MEIFYNANDLALVPPLFKTFAHGLVGGVITQQAGSGFIYDHSLIAIGLKFPVESTAGYHFNIIKRYIIEINKIQIEVGDLQIAFNILHFRICAGVATTGYTARKRSCFYIG